MTSSPFSTRTKSDMLLEPTEVDVELVERSKEFAEGAVLGELREGVDVLREALAAVAEFSIGTRHVGVGVVDVARKEATRMHLRPVRPHLLAVLLDGIEVGDLVGTEDVVRVFRDFGLERRHHGELLRGEDLDE